MKSWKHAFIRDCSHIHSSQLGYASLPVRMCTFLCAYAIRKLLRQSTALHIDSRYMTFALLCYVCAWVHMFLSRWLENYVHFSWMSRRTNMYVVCPQWKIWTSASKHARRRRSHKTYHVSYTEWLERAIDSLSANIVITCLVLVDLVNMLYFAANVSSSESREPHLSCVFVCTSHISQMVVCMNFTLSHLNT